ncbi:MAG: ATP-binding protein [Cyanobacteria bacterium P01_D01_bin.1]
MAPSIQKTEENRTVTQPHEEIAQLRDQVITLEELLLIYEQSATERESYLQDVLRKSEEKALQLQHSRSTLQTVKAILDSMSDAVVVIDGDGHTLFSNPAAAELLETKLLERNLASSFPDSNLQDSSLIRQFSSCEQAAIGTSASKAISLRAAILGKSVDNLEIHLEEQSRWLSINARPLESEGKSAGAVAVFRDATLAKESAQTLRRSNEEFRQQSKVLADTLAELKQTQAMLIHEEKMSSLGQTVAGIAHEINNPLSFIHGNLELMKHVFQELLGLIDLFRRTYPGSTPAIDQAIEEIDLGFISKDVPSMMASMSLGVGRIREIVRSLRVFSHLDESAVKAVDIHAGIDSACMVVKAQLDEQTSGNVIVIRKDYGSLPLIECHASQINQVVVHLLANAIYALRSSDKQLSPPEITICTETREGKIFIRISDNGIGIPKSIQSKIFDPFFTTKPVGKGTGLGLCVCHQIVVGIHQGAIACTSQEGIGTEFEITLPYT